MPRVPTLDTFQTGVAQVSAGRFDAPSGPGAGDMAARQLGQLGQAAQQAGTAAGRVAVDMQEQANQVRVIDAVTKAKERLFDLQYGEQGFTRAKGVEALQRPDGKLLADEYADKLKATGDELDAGLGNEAQRLAFRQQFGQIQASLRADAMRHVGQEFKTYQGATYDAAASAAKRQISLSYKDLGDDGPVAEGVRTVTAAVKEKARLLGMPQTWADEQVIHEVSGAHRLAIRTALENNETQLASDYLGKFKGSMTADDILAVRGVLDKEMRTRTAVQVGGAVVAELAPKLVPSDFDRLVGITMQSESGGRRYGKDGQLLTSSKGARGEMQVMPGTQRDPGFGVVPAKDDSPDELARVGRDYLRAMLKRYDGDAAKAWAAYNAGPGELDKALKDQAKNRAGTQGAGWLAYMPQETQAYVAMNLKLLDSGVGAPVAPTLVDVQNAVRTKLGPDADPMTVKAAVEHASQQWRVMGEGIKAREDGLVAEAQRQMIANNGNFLALPSSLRTALPPGKVDDLMTFGSKLAKGENVATDWNLYYRLRSDGDLLKSANLAVLRDKLAPSEFKHLTEEQAQLNKPGAERLTQLQTGKDILQGFMREAGLDPTPKDDDAEGAKKVGQLMAQFQERITAREQAMGKKLNDAELRAEAAALFKPVKTSGFLGFSREAPLGLVKPSDTVIVPDAERKQIADALRKAGRPVNDAAVEALYRAKRGIPQRVSQN